MKIEPLKTKIDPVKCMGNWYVQVAVPTPLDSGASNGLEQYSWDAEKERVSVVYDFDTPKGKKMTVQQIGGVTDKEFGTTWWVKPKIGFFYLVQAAVSRHRRRHGELPMADRVVSEDDGHRAVALHHDARSGGD